MVVMSDWAWGGFRRKYGSCRAVATTSKSSEAHSFFFKDFN